jgi:hypothetical protein
VLAGLRLERLVGGIYVEQFVERVLEWVLGSNLQDGKLEQLMWPGHLSGMLRSGRQLPPGHVQFELRSGQRLLRRLFDDEQDVR